MLAWTRINSMKEIDMSATLVSPETLKPVCEAALLILDKDREGRVQLLRKDHMLRKIWWFQERHEFSYDDLDKHETAWLGEHDELDSEIKSLLGACSDAEMVLVEIEIWRKMQQLITGDS